MNKRKHNATQAVINLAEEHGNETAAVLDQQWKKTKIPMATGNIHSFFDKVAPKFMGSTEKNPANGSCVQLLLTSNPTADSQLSMAICDLIHSCALPFSLASDPKFNDYYCWQRMQVSIINLPVEIKLQVNYLI